ncbi:hypothetical protein SAMN04489761_2071 [Tenacibaculum sp. MAR_2009_124]|nr:hypothetical protein SAMN04489761_2071 [Tenacibaculum sp. MAR_2009_124]
MIFFRVVIRIASTNKTLHLKEDLEADNVYQS